MTDLLVVQPRWSMPFSARPADYQAMYCCTALAITDQSSTKAEGRSYPSRSRMQRVLGSSGRPRVVYPGCTPWTSMKHFQDDLQQYAQLKVLLQP